MADPRGFRLLWHIWRLRWRFAFRDPYDVDGNLALSREIDRLETMNATYE